MGTRAVVLFRDGDSKSYRVYYTQYDGYPSWLGIRLARMLKEGKSEDEIVKELKLEDYGTRIGGGDIYFHPETLLRIQGDIEWGYVISWNKPREMTGFEIYRTSVPKPLGFSFAFRVWGSYLKFMGEEQMKRLENGDLELMTGMLLNAMEQFSKAQLNMLSEHLKSSRRTRMRRRTLV